jgi:hypothetical protein
MNQQQVQWTYDPTTPVPMIVVTCYQKTLTLPSQRWRWRAQALNYRKLANPGEGYSNPDDLAHALALLWPPETTRHVVVKGLP